MRSIAWLAEKLSASQGFCTIIQHESIFL